MATWLHDIPNNALLKEALASGNTVSAAATGAAAGMTGGDGNCCCIVQVGVNGSTGPATLAFQVLQSAVADGTGGGTFSVITGATAGGVSAATGTGTLTIGPFQRDGLFLKLSTTTSGTAVSYPVSAVFVEQKKQVGPTS